MKKISKMALLGCLALFSMQISLYAQSDSLGVLKNTHQRYIHKGELVREALGNSDYLRIEDKRFSINKSLISDFNGYKTLFPFALEVEANPPHHGRLFHYDKPYLLYWSIIDDTLYLADLQIESFNTGHMDDTELMAYDIACAESRYGVYDMFGVFQTFEKFIGRKFIKPGDKSHKRLAPFPDAHIMRADWVNGTYLIKEWNMLNKLISSEIIEFKDGILVLRVLLDK